LRPKHIKYLIPVVLLAALVSQSPAVAQKKGRKGPETSAFTSNTFQKVIAPPDSAELARRDSVHRADSIFRADSAAAVGNSSLDTPAFTAARDSIVEVFRDGHRMIYYYGDVSVTYGDMKLSAELMDYDMNTGTVYARGVYDSLAGEWKGRPRMEEGGKSYTMHELRYNFNSRKARITNMVTTEDEGILHGKNIKMMPDHSVNITDGKYTVCDLEHPHYYLGLTAAKVVPGENQKTVFGPAYLVVEDVVLPIALPFGFVPKRPQRATGMLMPTFGEEAARGFYVQDVGMYFVFGDYLDLSVTADFFTLGSWGVDLNSRYKINYKANGNLSFTYSDDRVGEKGAADYSQSTNLALRWTHTQDSKAHPGSSFSASVNFSSPSNNRFNSHSVNEALQNQASSSISYSKNWNGKVNLSVNALHSQNSRDESYSFSLPNISLSVSTFYPFKRKERVGKERFYEKISFGYSTSFQNRVSFKLQDFRTLEYDENGNLITNPLTGLPAGDFSKDSLSAKLPKMLNNGMNHNFSIGLPSFQLFKYITVNPSISYGMNWLFSKGDRNLEGEVDSAGNPVMVKDSEGKDVQAQKVVTDQGSAFNTFGVTQTGSASISASTRIYGMFNFGTHHKVQAIRHVISPSLSMSFSPEQGTYQNGWRKLDPYYDKNGTYHSNDSELYYNIYSLSTNNSGSAPGRGRSATASLSIGNNLEAKVRDFADTTGAGTKKVKLIDQLSLNTGYNFLADSMRMNNLSMSMSTSLFGKVSLSASAAFDPYAVNKNGARYGAWAITQGQGLLRFTNASCSASYSISGKGSINGNDGRKQGSGGSSPADYYQRIYNHPVTGEYIPGGWLYYTNPDVPWSLNFSYSLSYSKSWVEGRDNSLTQTLSMSGNIKLSPKMSVNMSTGFDFKTMQLTTSQLSATYDLHCFNISVSWVPFGKWQSYSFRIAANAAALADLLRYKKSSSYWDN